MKESILKVIAYFDVFSYPIKLEEIKFFLDQPFIEENLQESLKALVHKNIVWKAGDFYSLQNNPALVERRIKGNKAAVKQLKKAKRIARFLSWFPYVRGIAISGSLSKNFAYKGSDIDFFVITSANRLWIAKIFLIPIVRLVPWIGLRNWFCLNYFIDETALEIQEKNVFTATEIVTLIPCRGNGTFDRFFTSNQWVYDYLPNCNIQNDSKKNSVSAISKSVIELCFNNKIGNKLDDGIMYFFKRRWKKMLAQHKIKSKGQPQGAFIANKNYCKPFPKYFQQKVLDIHQEKMQKAI